MVEADLFTCMSSQDTHGWDCLMLVVGLSHRNDLMFSCSSPPSHQVEWSGMMDLSWAKPQ